MTELLDQGAAAIAAAVRTGKTKARDIAEMAIARVEARNKQLTAIVDFDPAEARASADAVDARRKQGFDGAILGVPYTVKDTTWVQGRTRHQRLAALQGFQAAARRRRRRAPEGARAASSSA